MPNRLIHETSPYLLQHANNPVDWYPWGEEAFAKAEAEDKPIFLSVGYSACHWCHVMEHESFENEAIAAIMNRQYVNIKVDREERPDVDAIYMDAVVALTQHGGWPMSVWLTPGGVPFYGGTYFPPMDRMGMPGFGRVLEALAEFYHRQKDKINQQGQQLLARMSPTIPLQSGDSLDAAVLELALQNLTGNVDYVHGGVRGAPKFPQPMTYDFLLRAYHRSSKESLLDIVELTLQKMARGGIYDQLGGGFHRYSTDALWLVPHFEKMLYDNALLARLYLHTYQLTGKADYKRVVEETLDYVAREMTDPLGGFYSTQDADSEGQEGKFFVWTRAEIKSVLGDEAGERFCVAYDVSEAGNWEGQAILWLKRPLAETAKALKVTEERLKAELAESRQKLFTQREKRVKPGRDDKVLTAWNGLMLAAFAEAARVLDRTDYLAGAVKNAEFVLTHLKRDNRLLRTWKGGEAKLKGYLEDYAFLADGLLALYQTTFDEAWFVEAKNLMEVVLAHFGDNENGGFFDTADDHEKLVVRPKSVQDNAIPSGNSMAVRVLLQLATYTGDARYYDPAIKALRGLQPVLSQYASGFAHWLGTLEYALAPVKEVALIGRADEAGVPAMLQILQKPYRPNQVVALAAAPTAESPVPLLNNRPQQNGRGTVYVCQDFVCRLPVTNAEDLKTQL